MFKISLDGPWLDLDNAHLSCVAGVFGEAGEVR